MSVRTVLTATHVAGPMWTIEGKPLVVDGGADPRALVTRRLIELSSGADMVPVLIRHHGQELHLLLGQDGALAPAAGAKATAALLEWTPTTAGHDGAEPLEERPAAAYELLSAHTGSGASTWAQLLDLPEVRPEDRSGAPLLLVTRSTIAGVEAAKPWTQQVSAVLMVADAPGKVLPVVDRAIRVLHGAAPIVRVPWVPVLRGITVVPEGAAVGKVVAKVAAAIEKDRRK